MQRIYLFANLLLQNSFWVGCGIIGVTCIVSWSIASSKIDLRNATLTSEIEAKFLTGDKILNVTAEPEINQPVHPNQKTNNQMRQAIAKTTASLKDAWVRRCQQQFDLLQPTPEVIEKNGDIAPLLARLQPAETHAKTQLPESILAVYKQHVPAIMPRLCKIIGTEWLPRSSENTDAENQGDSERIVCRWNDLNQEFWQSKLTHFINRDDNASSVNLPTASQLTMLEQDLRLLEGIFHVVRIANSKNGKMKRSNGLATIKQIDYVVFGREAYSKLGEIIEIKPKPNSAGQQSKPAPKIDFRNQPAYHARYIDRSGNYIPGTAASTAFACLDCLPEKNLDLVVVKRIPFRIAMRVDEREIGGFIAACENSAIPFHITQTRINVHDPNEMFTLKGGSDRGATPQSNRQMSVGMMGGLENNSRNAKNKDLLGPVESRIHYDVNAEFYGYAKIYCPVNESRLVSGK